MLLRILLLVVGVALVLLSITTTIPVLGGVGVVYLLVGWMYGRRTAARHRPFGTIRGLLAGAIGVMLVVGIGVLSLRARPSAPEAFYVVASEAPSRPGTLLRAEAFTRVVPANTRVRRILYTTTRSENVPAVASASVLAPRSRRPIRDR